MRRALLLSGGWPGHRPAETAAWAEDQLRSLGFEVERTADPYRLDGELGTYDLLVLGWSNVLTTEGLTKEQEHHLLSAVAAGTGVAGWHGMVASFRASLAYHLVIGGAFLEHPGGTDQVYRVTITDSEHEVTAGVRDFSVRTEQYYLQVDPNNRVLAETVFSGEHLPWLAGCRMPVAWVRTWGQGRVFYCAIGHRPADLAEPEVARMIRQGFGWAARDHVE
jgi:uncharacterized protein